MTARLVVRVGRGATVVRIARSAWGYPDRIHQRPDGTFGCRWDDPAGEFRVLYIARSAIGAYLESLAGFRRDPALEAFRFEPDPGNDVPAIAQATVPRTWIARRHRLEGRLHGRYLRVTATGSMGILRRVAAQVEVATGITLDASALRAVEPRAFTQAIGRVVFELPPMFDGISYASRHGDDEECIAVFERGPVEAAVRDRRERPIEPDDPDLAAALDLLGLTLGP